MIGTVWPGGAADGMTVGITGGSGRLSVIAVGLLRCSVIVNTSPSGATVTLGGLDAGKSPITFKGVVAGKYQLHITLSGYAPVDREVEVKAGQFLDLGTITLQRSKPTAITDNRPEPSVMPSAVPPSQTVPINEFSGG